MYSPGWLTFCFSWFVFCLIIAGVFGGHQQPLTEQDNSLFGQMSSYPQAEATGPAGSVISFFNMGSSALKVIGTALTADYGFFYNYDSITKTSTPNDFYFIRIFFLCINFAIFITLAIVAFRYLPTP